jgi:hypothetical protein
MKMIGLVPEPFFDKDNDIDSLNSFNNRQNHSASLNRGKMNRSVNSGISACPHCKHSFDRSDSVAAHNHKHHNHNKFNRRHNSNDISWENLGDKIEDWFEYAKTPGKFDVAKLFTLYY